MLRVSVFIWGLSKFGGVVSCYVVSFAVRFGDSDNLADLLVFMCYNFLV